MGCRPLSRVSPIASAGRRRPPPDVAERDSCCNCPVACQRKFHLGRKSGARDRTRLEYQTVCALGPMCGIDDIHTIARAAALCDGFGMDTVSTGVTIAWAMESFA